MKQQYYKASALRDGKVLAEDVFKTDAENARNEIVRRAKSIAQSFGGGRNDRVFVVPYQAA